MKHVVFTIGRFNPPTLGHLKLFDTVKVMAQTLGCDYQLFTTKTNDNKRNPLTVDDKFAFLAKLMPQYSFHATVNPFSACRDLAKLGYDSATIVVGEDRDIELVKQLNLYIGHEDPEKDIGLKAVDGHVVKRESTDYSASNARALAVEGNFKEFQKHIPHADSVTINQLYHTVRRNLGIIDG